VAATIFVDHASDLSYVHLMEDLTVSSTLQAKHAFEAFAHANGVNIKHYHCDNGRFADASFKEDVATKGQTISFSGVGAHHQNGIAEHRIRNLTESARSMILHAIHHWPQAITANLWPQALKHACNICNALPQVLSKSSPLSLFTRVQVNPDLWHFHVFGCPAYVLAAPLQTGAPFPKWEERSRVGVFLCHSPEHASSVALILNTQTGLVSPQFHVAFDNQFDTVHLDSHFTSLWQVKARFQAAQDLDFLAPSPDAEEAVRLQTEWPLHQCPLQVHLPREMLHQLQHKTPMKLSLFLSMRIMNLQWLISK
jgi:hypothetical protein